MNPSGGDQTALSPAGAQVDRTNSSFYGAFPYPWRPMNFLYPADGLLATAALSQSVGDFDHRRLPTRPDIWVAGCGTNQAAYLALQFPLARIVASDLSENSLALCEQTLRSMGVRNVSLRHESINDAGYHDQFDFIVSTGVVHHNAEPRACLERLGKALKPSGIAEIMVYNQFHRPMNTAFQETLRLMEVEREATWQDQLALTRRLGRALPAGSPSALHFASLNGEPDARVADSLLQPVEHSYTVESFFALCEAASMLPITYRVSDWDKSEQRFGWNLSLSDEAIRDRYHALPDRARWQICNLMMGEQSPMLWFYLQRNDCPWTIPTEAQMDEAFLDRSFVLADVRQRCYSLTPEGGYRLLGGTVPAPPVPSVIPWAVLAPLLADGLTPRQAMTSAGLGLDRESVNRMRILLTTSAFPYLKSKAQQALQPRRQVEAEWAV